MNKKQTLGKAFLGMICLVLLLFAGCDGFEAALREEIQDGLALGSVDSSLVTANTEFGFNLFNAIWETERNQNIFVSPFSVSTALTMTLNGASGETEHAMTNTLQLQGVGTDSVNSGYAQLQQILQASDPKVTLTIANSLWAREGIQFTPNFLQRNTQFFDAEISKLDFTDPSALTTINQWVNSNTNGKIPKILDKIDSNAVLFLINAIYFKGTWQTEFDPLKTRDGPFNLETGSKKQVPMMTRSGRISYYRDENVQAVNLPYGDGRISMSIFLPSWKSNLNNFLGSVNAEKWENWISQFHEQEMSISIPKFKLEYGTKELNDALTHLGMGIAFDQERADFSRMAPLATLGGNLYIEKVAHKTFIEVNEEGTEAAAATSVGIGVKSIQPVFIVDRPFFFAIWDNKTNTVLFMGAVVDPQP